MTNRMLLFSKALCHSGWLLEFLDSSRIYRPVFVCGKETPAFFSSSRKPSEGGENTAVPATFARDEVSFFVFLKLVKCAMFTLPVQNLELISPVCQT